MGRISPDYIVQDGVIPRTALPEVLRAIAELSGASGVRVANVFHAGDGNLHPLVLFDDAVAGEAERAEEVSGRDPRPLHRARRLDHRRARRRDRTSKYMPQMFTDDDLDIMQLVRCAFDPADSPTRARSSRRRGCAARCPGGTGRRTRCGKPAREVF